MATETVSSLTDLAGRLERQLGNPVSFRGIVTRVLLRTGVNMREPKPEQNRDMTSMGKVTAALAEMGYRL